MPIFRKDFILEEKIEPAVSEITIDRIMSSSILPLERDSIINPIKDELKELVIEKGFKRYESGHLTPHSSRKALLRW